MNQRLWQRIRGPELWIVLVLWAAAWLPRSLALDRFVTADERLWLARAANFYYALAHGDLANTFQREHPGVTVMWAGALGFLSKFPAYAQVAPGQFGWDQEELESWLRSATTHLPIELLAAGRWWVTLAIALAITACYFPLRRLLGQPVAIVATLLLAWNPFFIALSRELHPDGLVAALSLAALLYFLAWLYRGRRRLDLVLSAFLMGLAWLTKTPAIFLIPTAALLVGVAWFAQGQASGAEGGGARQSVIVGFVLWGLLAVATFVLLWPAMWVEPVATLRRMVAEMSSYIEGHVNPNFFLGQTTADPGPWFYPVAYWLRMTPATLVGLLAAAVWWWRRPSDAQPSARHTVMALALYAFVFTGGMTLGSKKFDRYLLPIFPALDIIAALGLVGLAQLGWPAGKKEGQEAEAEVVGYGTAPSRQLASRPSGAAHRFARTLVPALVVVVLLHGLPGFVRYPYYLTYYNPLAGGGAAAERLIMVGWGEGLEQAANWLNQQPDAERAGVVAWYGDGPLSYFLHSRAPVLSFWSPEYWLAADYAVVYISQRQRQIPDGAVIDYFAGLPPAQVISAAGLELARIYTLHERTPPAFTGLYTDSAGELGSGLRLAGYTLGERNWLAGDVFVLRLFLAASAPPAPGARTVVHLLAPAGEELLRSAQPLAAANLSNTLYRQDHLVRIPAGSADGAYTLALTVEGQTEASPARTVTTLAIAAARQVALTADWGVVRMSKVEVPTDVAAGDELLVKLTASGQVDGSLKLSARLVGPDGASLAQADDLLTAETTVALTPPAETKAGDYTLAVVVYDPHTLNPLADGDNQFATPLTLVTVRPPGS